METPAQRTTPPHLARVYWQAIRPATLWAAVVPVWVGVALALERDIRAPAAAFAALLGAVAIQIGTNLFNDYADFKSGADTEERIGPKRATQQGWLSEKVVLASSGAAFAVALVAGVYLALVAGWAIFAVGVVSICCGIAYTGGPYPLAYYGLGDIFVFVFFGVVAVVGTFYVQTQALSAEALVAGSALGLLCTGILVVNNLRDRHTDRKAGKNTLAVRFGARFSRWQYAAVMGTPFALVSGVALLQQRWGWLLPLLLLPAVAYEVRAIFRTDGQALNPHLGKTAQLELLFGGLLGIGVLL